MIQALNLRDAQLVGESLRTCLGPKARNKLVVKSNGEVFVTNDGLQVLEELYYSLAARQLRKKNIIESDANQHQQQGLDTSHLQEELVFSDSFAHIKQNSTSLIENQELELQRPAIRMILDAATRQKACFGDGTTSVAVVCSELCAAAEKLLRNGIHPLVISSGFREALSKAICILRDNIAMNAEEDNLMEMALKVAESSTRRVIQAILATDTSVITKAIRSALLFALKQKNKGKDLLKVIESRIMTAYIPTTTNSIQVDFYEGTLLQNKRMKCNSSLGDVYVAVLSFSLDIPKLKTKYNIEVNNLEQYSELDQIETDFRAAVITALLKNEIKMVFSQWSIDSHLASMLNSKDIECFSWVSAEDMENIALTTGASICCHIDDLGEHSRGIAKKVTQIENSLEDGSFLLIESDFSGVGTLVVNGEVSSHQNFQSVLRDGLNSAAHVLLNGKIVPGGGSSEIQLYRAIADFASTRNTEDHFVILAWAESMMSIPSAIAKSCGADELKILNELRNCHKEGHKHHGIFVSEDCNYSIEDMTLLGVFECLATKEAILTSSTEVASLIVSIDSALICNDIIV